PGVVRSRCGHRRAGSARRRARRSEPPALGPDRLLALARALRVNEHDSHNHAHGRAADYRRIAIALTINVAMLVAGVVGGLVFHSLALLADAGHVLADVAGLGLALLAGVLATRPASPRRT